MTFTMYDCAAVGVYPNHTDAEAAVRMLVEANIPLQSISIIGCDEQSQEALRGRYSPPDYVEHGIVHDSEREGIWIGGLFGLLAGFGSFVLPGIGLLVVLGPLAGLVGGMAIGAIGGEITGQLAFTEVASDYREWLVLGDFLVIVHCTTEEEPRVRQVLESIQSLQIKSHHLRVQASPTTEDTVSTR